MELRFFTGLTEHEAAEALEISVATLKRDWNFARAWLFDRLNGPAGEAAFTMIPDGHNGASIEQSGTACPGYGLTVLTAPAA